MAKPTRDPRTDPRPGDVIARAGRPRTVVYRSQWGTVIYDTRKQSQLRCTLATWKKWARGAEVTRAFEGYEPINKAMLTLMTRGAEGQVNALANEFMSDGHRRPYPGRPFSTPFDDMARAIFDYGLHAVVTNQRARATVFKGLKEWLRARRKDRDGEPDLEART